jgi:hypothetical protein
MTFTINVNNITILASSQKTGEREVGTDTFRGQLHALAAQWSRLVEIWYKLPRMTPVERFTSRQVATRFSKAIQNQRPTTGTVFKFSPCHRAKETRAFSPNFHPTFPIQPSRSLLDHREPKSATTVTITRRGMTKVSDAACPAG